MRSYRVPHSCLAFPCLPEGIPEGYIRARETIVGERVGEEDSLLITLMMAANMWISVTPPQVAPEHQEESSHLLSVLTRHLRANVGTGTTIHKTENGGAWKLN